ncbi:MAG: ribbon-helix-helix domain-containing protein [Hyphomicrobiales bacterium]|nr:ribbon-helix-helix domain-containing protein [Hyphomicrobiales bacterium]
MSATELLKRSLTIKGHRTSVALEAPFWQALDEIADRRGISRAALITEIDAARVGESLSSAIRVYVLDHFRKCATVDG